MADELGFSRLSDSDRDQFRIAMGLLFTEGFLVRGIEHHERPYRFVLANRPLFDRYLDAAGWELRVDEALGVVAFVGPPSARLRLRKEESMIALILRLLYEEKAGEIALHGGRTARRHEIQDRYRALAGSTLRKTPFLAILRRLSSLRLIRLLGEESDPDAAVLLYPSLAFAIDARSIEALEARVAEYRSADSTAGDAGTVDGAPDGEADAESDDGSDDIEPDLDGGP